MDAEDVVQLSGVRRSHFRGVLKDAIAGVDKVMSIKAVKPTVAEVGQEVIGGVGPMRLRLDDGVVAGILPADVSVGDITLARVFTTVVLECGQERLDKATICWHQAATGLQNFSCPCKTSLHRCQGSWWFFGSIGSIVDSVKLGPNPGTPGTSAGGATCCACSAIPPACTHTGHTTSKVSAIPPETS